MTKSAKTIDLADYDSLVGSRIDKFTGSEVGYQKSPEGSALRCAGCLHYFRRAIDGFAICEIMRPDEDGPVAPDWRCHFQTIDGDQFPLLDRDD